MQNEFSKELSRCKTCDFVTDTPLGSYCNLTYEAIETTDCHYHDEIARQKDYEDLMRHNMFE